MARRGFSPRACGGGVAPGPHSVPVDPSPGRGAPAMGCTGSERPPPTRLAEEVAGGGGD